jgi:hypothetical protein
MIRSANARIEFCKEFRAFFAFVSQLPIENIPKWLNLHKGTKCEIGIARNACLGAVESTASEVSEEPVTRPVAAGHRNP